MRTAIPPSDTKPTRLATVSVCPVSTWASTPPTNAVGMALRIWKEIRAEGYSIIRTTKMPASATPASTEMRSVAERRASNCPPRSRTYPSGNWTRSFTFRSMSATALPRSRPETLQRTTWMRRTFSRLTRFGPLAALGKSATSLTRI